MMENITPEEIRKILLEHGTIVSLAEASVILDFLVGLANLTLDEILKT